MESSWVLIEQVRTLGIWMKSLWISLQWKDFNWSLGTWDGDLNCDVLIKIFKIYDNTWKDNDTTGFTRLNTFIFSWYLTTAWTILFDLEATILSFFVWIKWSLLNLDSFHRYLQIGNVKTYSTLKTLSTTILYSAFLNRYLPWLILAIFNDTST